MTVVQLQLEPSTHGVGPLGDGGVVAPATMTNKAQRAPAAESGTQGRHGILDCGWGRLLYAPSFESPKQLAQALLQEQPGRRDIALYVEDPQLVLAEAPSQLFLDPSLLFRRPLDAADVRVDRPAPGVVVRPLTTRADIAAINRLYAMRRMVPLDPAVVWAQRQSEALTYLVAEDERTGEVIGSVLGIDHVAAFDDPQGGTSLWCLAVDPQTRVSGAGESLTQYLVAHFARRGRAFLDLSVLHDNEHAIGLYQRLGFQKAAGFVIKHKNAINQRLFGDTEDVSGLNPYARLIVDEARRRGISAEVVDAPAGIFKLRHFGHEVLCRESLTELTGGVAMTWCQDKVLTLRRLASIGLRVPRQRTAGDAQADAAFMCECGSVVVKPALGEQGRGISVDVRTEPHLVEAIARAAKEGGHVVIEEFCAGQDLRIVVIGYKVVAAAIRRPAEIVGDGQSTVAKLIERQSARRAAATGGESRIPVDAETERCLAGQGLAMDSVLPPGQAVNVRKTANLHTGGTIHDVTAQLHPLLREAAETAARALRIPVVGLDFLVPSPDQPEYVVIEANERPGLANHEPQPTAQRFVDLLFPFTA
ncbi:N-acetylglutaminylglutamine synthetase [Ramlibacter tataouinensis]|uniref:Acetyltransferases-like protein n=1 Tax=Ramlibacter tataouinensis (strain ATCC BAA-407 / DSM 14655 / LMG 21543 / TTB310) TaxID=365046 RepID=F5XZH8_RAMTT|nr:N-acetylglutaminylglutamine synthetase [Ramlibacter tataouinensis]AEG94535.1 acetyltransferases-like protein [Ramlibacter tataouinensis TTB310]